MSSHDGEIGQEFVGPQLDRRTVSELIDYAIQQKMTTYVFGYLVSGMDRDRVLAAVLDCEHHLGRHAPPGGCPEQCPRF